MKSNKNQIKKVSFYFEVKRSPKEGIDWLVIKRFIKKIEETASEALIAILFYIDDKLDRHDNRLDELEDRLEEFEGKFNPTVAEVESQSNTRKLVKKTGITAGVGIFIGWILKHFGIF